MARAPSICWFRRDLRVDHHDALSAAASAGPVVPLFVVDPAFDRAGAARRSFLARRLVTLQAEMGGPVVVRHGSPADEVLRVAKAAGATEVFVTRDYTPFGRDRDRAVAAHLQEHGVRLVGVGSNYVHQPGTVTKADGGAYSVFTPFARAWRAVELDNPPATTTVDWYVPPADLLDPLPIDPLPDTIWPPASASEVEQRWRRFTASALDEYDEHRDRPALDGTSRLSAALRWGVVHPRSLLADLEDPGRHRRFVDELIWREFYADVLLHRPDSRWRNVDRRLDALPTDRGPRAEQRFVAWCEGRTGYPIVDAGMRQLVATGWMHNRVRMITASFLTKDLHLPWQWGERFFMRHLVDGDRASNVHGWQWVAGTGTDAAPFFRIFNPTAQGERFDPDGEYVRRWVPELADLPDGSVHQPGNRRPESYPPPIVDHAEERRAALDRYAEARAR